MRRILSSAILSIATSLPGAAWGQLAITSEIAPTEKLRVTTPGTSPILLTRTSDGSVRGLFVDLGKFIADRIGVPFEPVVYPTRNAFDQSFGKSEWDIAIGGRIAFAAGRFEFSPDFMLADEMYIAAPGREFADAGQVDRPGVKIAVSRGAGADHTLSKALKSAEFVRASSGVGVNNAIETLRGGKAEVWTANPITLQAIADGLPGAKIVSGAWSTAPYAVALPKGRSAAAQAKLAEIVNEAKGTGVVAKAIEQTGFKGVRLAPN